MMAGTGRSARRLLALPCSARLFSHRLCSTRASAPLLSDERIQVPHDYNRWLQLLPASLSGLSIGTYLATPTVLGPLVCRAQGVLAQTPSDFAMTAIPTCAVLGGVTVATASVLLAPYAARIGTRRFALASPPTGPKVSATR